MAVRLQSGEEIMKIYADKAYESIAPGMQISFKIKRGHYSGDGRYTNLKPRGKLTLINSGVELYIASIEDVIDFNHVINAWPYKNTDVVNIDPNIPMLYSAPQENYHPILGFYRQST